MPTPNTPPAQEGHIKPQSETVQQRQANEAQGGFQAFLEKTTGKTPPAQEGSKMTPKDMEGFLPLS